MKIKDLPVKLNKERAADTRGGILDVGPPARILDVGSSKVIGVDNDYSFGSLQNQPFTPHSSW